MSIIIVDDLGTIPAAPAGYDLALIQGIRSAPAAVPQRSIAMPRADVAGTKYGTILYDGSGVALKYLGGDGAWHPVIATKGAAAHKFLTSYDQTTGLLQNGQPAATDLSDFTLASLTAGDLLVYDGAVWKNKALPRPITSNIDGGGAAPGLGFHGYIQVPFAATIIGWAIACDSAIGNIEYDIKKCADGAFPTTASIVAALPPKLVAQQKNSSSTLTAWTTAITANDWLEVRVTSLSGGLTWVTLEIYYTLA